MRCDSCALAAVTLIPYSGAHMCRAHFAGFVERRAKAEIRRQLPHPSGARIGVAVSGGKDSLACLQILHDVLGTRRDVELLALTVDEGIAGYRAGGVEAASALCKQLAVEHRVVRFADAFGTTTDEIVLLQPDTAPCASCGVLRRSALNRAAGESACTHLATGHNLDDVAQTVLMNVARADVVRLARLGPHLAPPTDGMVPRLMPLRRIPEREVALYALIRGLPAHIAECPHSRDANRQLYRELVLRMEAAEPGTRHRLLAFHDRLAPMLRSLPSEPVRACRECGQPASGDVCKACQYVGSVKPA